MIQKASEKILQEYLNRIAPIPENEWQRVSSAIKTTEFKSGEYFVKAGDEASHIGFVMSGLLKKFYRTDDGKEFIKDFSLERQLVTAYSSLLLSTESRLNIQAIENTQLLVIPYATFTALYPFHPCWQELGRKIAETLFIEREQREWELLIFPAKERYQIFEERYSSLLTRVPQYEIASYLGISPISLSRLIGKKHSTAKKERS